ncbi:MAG TPA: adenylosuccinate synthase [Longimicrobiales bacterium]|nr:adenylosuccinate synthase [Longimicrobiales bacterium]
MAPQAGSGRCSVIVGCQWGDEGKGKIVDVLAEDVDIVARYQGGANAGHTVHVGSDEFILHQIPSGILHDGKRCLLGNGVVLDLLQFFQEYDALKARGIDVDGRVGISQRAHLLMPYHRFLDQLREDKAAEKIGTTGRGIGPAYEEKAGRRGIRVADVANSQRFQRLVDDGVARARDRLRELGGQDESSLDEAMDRTLALRDRLLGLATDTGLEIVEALDAGKNVLLEGAQGTALDLDHGTYPFVTSSNTTAAGAATGVGIGPTRIHEVVGVVKAYTTRVGNGPLPTGSDAGMDEKLRRLGGEFGATTGRPRRCGWFDAVLARYAARVNGLTGLAVTKLDVLDTLPEISIGLEYCTPDGVCTGEFPADTFSLASVEPRFETLPGWEADTTGCRTLEDLPRNARAYLDRIQELTGTPIRWISVGTRRDQIIFVD